MKQFSDLKEGAIRLIQNGQGFDLIQAVFFGPASQINIIKINLKNFDHSKAENCLANITQTVKKLIFLFAEFNCKKSCVKKAA